MSPSRDYMEVRTEKGSRTFGALQKYKVAFMNCVDEVGHSKVVGNMQIIQALFQPQFWTKKTVKFQDNTLQSTGNYNVVCFVL